MNYGSVSGIFDQNLNHDFTCLSFLLFDTFLCFYRTLFSVCVKRVHKAGCWILKATSTKFRGSFLLSYVYTTANINYTPQSLYDNVINDR